MRTWIKFCGTTSLADAQTSISAGADALGFIFAPSKRHVSVEQAAEIIRQLPAKVEKIGVFMDESAENILRMVQEAGLTGVQLHGKRSADDLGKLAGNDLGGNSLRVIKTVIIKDGFSDELRDGLGSVRPPNCVLLDSGTGSGKTFVWEDVKSLMSGSAAQVIVAGGLTPENVGAAVMTLSPWGVDVVSGIEKQAGQKDPQKLRAFVDAVRKAEKRSWEARS